MLITARQGRLDQTAARSAATDVKNRLGALEEVREIGDPVPSRDGDALLMPVTMAGDDDTANEDVSALIDQTAAVQQAHQDVRVEQVRAELAELSRRTQDDPLFANVTTSVITVSNDRRVTTLEVPTPHFGGTEDGQRSLAALRGTLVPTTIGTVSGAEYAVGGEVAENEDYTANLADRMPVVIGFVLLMTFLIMAWTFRSLVVAASALLLSLLSAAAAFGTMTLVFQHSWAEGVLGFRSNGTLVAWIRLFVFVVLFGLSVDYHVFVVSRVREAARTGLSTRDAVAHGISRSAGVVTSAAILMVSVFAIFPTLSMNELKQMGVGLAAAVFIDAMIVRVLVLPSLMALLGKANWWPGRIDRNSPLPHSPVDDHSTEQLPAVIMRPR